MTGLDLPFDWTTFENALPSGDALTPWFPRSTAPVHVGPYRVSSDTGYCGWSWWHGDKFGNCYVRIAGAIENRGHSYQGRDGGLHAILHWRGCMQHLPFLTREHLS
ncbi:hypothetical protein [Caldimonas sp. KR1-144]|uniref:hypothetical protein n=1 Tax=Caldimonas sp. KR1-144 TaxID=3400911 RepID=UPI003C0D372B